MNRLKKEKVLPLIKEGLREDIGSGDITADAIIPEGFKASGWIELKEKAVLSGLDIVEWVFNELGEVEVNRLKDEGVWLIPGRIIEFSGDARAIVMGERLALNFVQRLSGISTMTRRFVDEIEDMGVEILDTRKTTPGMRYLQKYAVSAGGGNNHRMGLYDEVLIKENHITIAGGIENALDRINGEIEVKNLKEMKRAVKCGAKRLLLDNFTIGELKEATEFAKNKNLILEVSGGVTISRIREIASTGVDCISVGALTHSYKSIDLSLILE